MQTKGLINGEWVEGKGTFEVVNPATGEVLAAVADCGAAEAAEAVAAAKAAFVSWRKVLPRQRSGYLATLEAKVMEKQKELATLLTKEMGKPLAEAMGEVGFAASFFGWFAGEARREYGDYVPSPFGTKELIHIRQPVGVAAMITPWNFPIGMIARKVGAALAAGCTCVLKPAEDTPLVALAFAEIANEVLPAGVFNILPASRTNAPGIGEFFCSSPDVGVISFTGSTEVGQWLYARAAATVKKVALELGGNAPFIIFPSADMTAAVEGAMACKFRNSGQTCVTANRFFVHTSIMEEFVAKFKDAMASTLKLGNGLEAGVNQGPLINERQYEKVKSLVESAVAEGCGVVLGGPEPHPLGRTFFPPTLLSGVKPTMKVFREEVFGPVVAIVPFETEEEVLALANDNQRGLAGYFYSTDISQIFRVAKAMEVGMVGVNEPAVSSCEAVFGGVKQSGLGIEGSKYGTDEYSILKLIALGNIQQ